MNSFYLKFLTLTLALSIHGIASTPDDKDNKMFRGAVSTAPDARVERMQQAIGRAQASYGPLSYCLPSGAVESDRSAVAVARVAVASDAPTDRNLESMTTKEFSLFLYNTCLKKEASTPGDDGHKKAIPLNFESHHPMAVAVASNAPAVAVASDAVKQCEGDAELLALLPQEEAAEQARLLAHYAAEKATDDFLRAERDAQREAQANLLAAFFAAAPYLVAPAAAADPTPEERCASFEAAANEAREKVTIFPELSHAEDARYFKVKVGNLIEKALEGDSIELFGTNWKITNHGDFLSEFRGNCDHESMIEPTVVDTTNKDNLAQLTYTFKKADGALVELKLEYVSPKPKKNL